MNKTDSPPSTATPADVEVYIGGALKGSYPLAQSESTRQNYAGVDNGPVQVISTNDVPIIASERILLGHHPTYSSYSEFMGIPASKLSDTYLFPWYNNVDLDTQLRFGNVGNANTTVTVKIGGALRGTYPLAPNQSTRVSFAGANNGPLQVQSSGGVPIIAAERVIYKVNGVNTSFSEMMGLPEGQLTDTYFFPWYNNVDLDTQLRFANAGTSSTTVTVTVGGVVQGTYPLAPNQSRRVSFAGVNNGPVRIVSSDAPILAAERVIFKVNGINTSFSEMMGLPASELTTEYWMPWYNNVDLDTQLRFGNTSASQSTTVSVYIGGVLQDTFNLGPSESRRVNFAGMNNGPVRILSSGAPILAAERVIFKVNGINTSFTEMMGLPNSQLDTTYWMPWYNNVDLDTQLRFGVP